MPEIARLPEEVVKIMGSIVDAAQDMYTEHGHIDAAFFVIDPQDQVTIVPVNLDGELSKDIMSGMVKLIAQKLEAKGIIFVDEAWSIEGDHADDFMKNRDKYESVSKHPGAKEIVMFGYESEDNYWMGRATPKDGDIGEIVWTEAKDTRGRFSNLMPGKSNARDKD